MKTLLSALVMSCLLVANAYACQPLADKHWEDSPKRVKANFDAAQFVVVATVAEVRTLSISPDLNSNFKIKIERVKFRVDRSFKGKRQVGDTFEIDSGHSFCSSSIFAQHWWPFVPGKKTQSRRYPKQWLIYYTPIPEMVGSSAPLIPFEIEVSPLTRPVSQASYDSTILEKLKPKLFFRRHT